MKVLIVGAGPTGLTLGVELARHGIIADVIDKRDQASTFSRAVGILPKSLQLLEPSGACEGILSEAIQIRTAKIFSSVKPLAQIDVSPTIEQFGYDFIAGLAQDRTETHLVARFKAMGGKVRYSCGFTDLVQDDEKVSVSFNDGNNEVYDYVVGADGVRSTVREALGLAFKGYELPEKWSIADVEVDKWEQGDSFTVCLAEKGSIVVVVPLEENRYRVISNTKNALETLPLPISVANIRREGAFQISIRQVDKYQLGRVFLAGDAAHCHSPVGGRGMNLGIADACDLAKRFAEGGLDGYSESRHKKGASIIAQTERMRKAVTHQNPIVRYVLVFAIGILTKFKFVQSRISNVILYGANP